MKNLLPNGLMVAVVMMIATASHAEPRTSLKASEVVLERCSKDAPNKCQFRVNSSILKSFQAGFHQNEIVIFLGEQQVYSAQSFRIVAKDLGDGTLKIRLISQGTWEMDVQEREAIQNKALVALVSQRKKSPIAAESNRMAVESALSNYKSNEVSYTAKPESVTAAPKIQEAPVKANTNAGVAERTYVTPSPTPESTGEKLAMNAPIKSGADKGSDYDRFEKWAMGKSSEDYPVVNIRYKMGSPNSPSGYQGGQVDFFLRPIFSLGLAAGSYSSNSFLQKEAGAVKYNVTSATSQLKIGSKGGALVFGMALSQIDAQYKTGTGIPSKKGASLLSPDERITEDSKSSYLGLSPSLGLRFESSSFYLLTLDYGTFIPLGGDGYNTAKKPTVSFAGKNDKITDAKSNWFSLGMGVGF